MDKSTPMIKLAMPVPLSNFPPLAGERANESLREFHVKTIGQESMMIATMRCM
jgi:hypothetical protein